MSENNHVPEVYEPTSTKALETLDYFDGMFLEVAMSLREELWGIPETELEKKFDVTSNDFLIRKRIHSLVNDAIASGSRAKIPSIDIYRDICSRQNFFTNLMKNQYRIAWWLIPVKPHEDIIEEGFYHAIKKVRDEVLTLQVNEKTAPVIMKALEFFTNRHLGPMIQKIEQKSMTMRLNQNINSIPLDPEAMLSKYNEAKSKMISAPTDVIEPDEPT